MNVATTRGYAWLVAAAGLLACAQAGGSPTDAARPAGAAVQGFDVSVEIALASLQSLSDGQLQKMADSMHLLATGKPARSADWDGLKEPLAELAKRNAAALNWFALPDGSYWSLQDGKEPGNLAGRDYFPKVLAGETVLGQLVYSTATGKPVAIVAVPVFGAEGAVVAVLGASIYLDELSAVIGQQMGIDEGLIFYSFDHTGTVALVWDKDLIFFEPRKSADEGLARAFDEMLAAERGIVSYTFRDAERTVVFRRSPLTGWWYAFGIYR
jgi:methyl-accepting chemotaxis protein